MPFFGASNIKSENHKKVSWAAVHIRSSCDAGTSSKSDQFYSNDSYNFKILQYVRENDVTFCKSNQSNDQILQELYHARIIWKDLGSERR